MFIFVECYWESKKYAAYAFRERRVYKKSGIL